jgi:hypothetical protein
MVKKRKNKLIKMFPAIRGDFVLRSITVFEVQFIPTGGNLLEDSGESIYRFTSGKGVSAFLKSQGLKEK